MRICIANTLYFPTEVGGAERSVRLLAEGLVRRGHSVRVVAIGRKADTYELDGARVDVLRLANLYWPFDAAKRPVAARFAWHLADTFNPVMMHGLRRVLRDHRAEVLHTNNLLGWSVAAWSAAISIGVPVVHTLRDYYLECPKSKMFRDGQPCPGQCTRCRNFTLPRRILSQRVSGVVGISRFILDSHLRAGYLRNASREMIHNAIDDSDLALTRRDRQASSAVTFGYIGRIDRSKGIEVAIDALRAVADPRALLRVAGDGDRDYLRTLLSRAQGLPVEFAGQVPAARFLAGIDVLVVPSLWHEPMGRIVVEAYAAGIPVLAARRGGLPEVVTDGITGFLFEPGPSELAELMRRLLDERQLRLALGDGARRRTAEFSRDAVAARYEAFYHAMFQ
jgi:glycosyltransferase involved in cell wall biosynthesis